MRGLEDYLSDMTFPSEAAARKWVHRTVEKHNKLFPGPNDDPDLYATNIQVRRAGGGKFKVGPYRRPRKPRFSWDDVRIIPNSLEHLRTGGYINAFDGQKLGPIKLVRISTLVGTDSNQPDLAFSHELSTKISNLEIDEFVAVLVQGTNILDGHHRVLALAQAGIKKVPTQQLLDA